LLDGAPDQRRDSGVFLMMIAGPNRRVVETWVPIASISMHALARWFERSGFRQQEALIAALATLVDAPAEVEQVTTERGYWLGGVIDVMDHQLGREVPLRSTRTWVATQ
jgi:hypothetical protein